MHRGVKQRFGLIPWGNRPCHQIALYYKVHLSDLSSIPLDGTFQGYDDLGNERIDF